MDPLIPQKRLKELGVGGLAFKTLLGARVGCHTAPAFQSSSLAPRSLSPNHLTQKTWYH